MTSSTQIQLPKRLGDWAEQQAQSAGLKDAGAYVQRLLREEQKRQNRKRLEADLLRAAASGFQEVTDATWAESEKRVLAKIQAAG